MKTLGDEGVYILSVKYANYRIQPYKCICYYLGDNCIQNIHLGRYIVGYTVVNLVLRQSASGGVKRDFRKYI